MSESKEFAVREVPHPAWDEFARTAVGGTPFCSSRWLACAAAAAGARPLALGAFRRDQLVAGAAGWEAGQGRRRRFATPDLLPHTGFLFRPAASDRPTHVEAERTAATQALLTHLQAAYPRVCLTHAPDLADMRPFQWSGWQVTPRFTYWLDLPADRKQLWDGLERRARTEVRKAGRGAFRVEPAADAGELRRLYGLVYAGQAEAPVAGACVEAMVGGAVDAGLAEGFRARAPGGETACAVYFASGGDTLYAWVAGADPAFRGSGAASLLYWTVLEQTRCRRFDFVGANIPSIALFKRSFGGRLVPYFAVDGYRSRWRGLVAAARRATATHP